MTTTTNLIDPKAHDARYVELLDDAAKARHFLLSAEHDVRRSAGQKYDYRTGGYTGTLDAALDSASGSAVSAYRTATSTFQTVLGLLSESADVYRQHGWARFFLVPGGHVHSSMECSTCNREGRQTAFALVPELSDESEAEAVAELGAVLCTVCFPSAPVEQTDGSTVGRRTLAEREAKADAKAAKRAEKLAKAILPDGEALDLCDGSPTTIVATQRILSGRLGDLAGYGPEHPCASDWIADARTCAEALAARLDGDANEIVAAAATKASKRLAKETAEAAAAWARRYPNDAVEAISVLSADELRSAIGPLA